MARREVIRAWVVVLSAVVPTVATTACHDPTDVVQLVYVRVDGGPFLSSIEGVATVRFSVVNPGDDTVYVDRCGTPPNAAVDRWQDDQWTQYRTGICPQDAVFGPITLGPGEHVESSTELYEPGRYRLRIGAWMGSGTPVNWNATSNAFDVQGPISSASPSP